MVTPAWLAALKRRCTAETKPGKSFFEKVPPRLMFATSAPISIAYAIPAKIELPGAPMLLQGKGLQGLFMGSNNFKRDIPMLANLYLQGRLKLDELVAARIDLDEVNDGYAAMRKGTEARSVIVF